MASGDTLAVWTALANEPLSVLFATPDTRNAVPCLDLDADTDESAVFSGVLPRNYAGGGITVYIHWRASSGTVGSVRWQTAFERGNTDIDSADFAPQNSAGGTPNATSGISTVTAIAHADGAEIDSLAAGEEFRLRVNRDANGTSGTDDMSGDAELYKVELKET